MKQSERDYAAYLSKVSTSVLAWESLAAAGDSEGVLFDEIRIRVTADHPDGYFVVVRGHRNHEELVAFYGGYVLGDVLIGLTRKARGSGMKWRENKPFGQ